MELTVLGASGSVSGAGEPASSYLVRAGDVRLVLDLGPGAFGALWAALDPREVTAYLISHLHPDHCLDLCAANVAARHSPTAPWPKVPVLAPAHARDRLDRANGPDPTLAPTDWAFDFQPWQHTQQIGTVQVSTTRTAHPTETYAMRLEHDGVSLTYTADTGWSDDVVELAEGTDLLLAEAAFVDRPGLPGGLHLTGREAGRMAARAGVGQLVITHVPPWHSVDDAVAEAATEFDGPIHAASRDRIHRLVAG